MLEISSSPSSTLTIHFVSIPVSLKFVDCGRRLLENRAGVSMTTTSGDVSWRISMPIMLIKKTTKLG